MSGNARIQLPNGLSFEIDAKHYARVSQCEWAIVHGQVVPAYEQPSWMSARTLARHLAEAKEGDWMLFKNDYRLDLTEKNIKACTPTEWRRQRATIPIPDREIPVSIHEGIVWSHRFGAWTLPYYVKQPGSPNADFFATEDDAKAYAEELRARFEGGETVLAHDLGLQLPTIKVAAKYSVIELYSTTSLRALVPPGSRTPRAERGLQSAQVVLLILRFFCQRPGIDYCYASQETIRRIIGARDRHIVANCLERLCELDAIWTERNRSTRIGKHKNSYFRKWACQPVEIKVTEGAGNEEPGLFPAHVFNDERFQDLSHKAQAALIALCLFARGQETATFSLAQLKLEAFISSDKHALSALDELSKAEFIAGFETRDPGQKLGSLRNEMTLGIKVLDLID